MRILLADPDRDLLDGYRKLLEPEPGEVVTAFDGPQFLRLFSGGGFDIAVLNSALPRVDMQAVFALLERENVPSVALLAGPLRAKILLRPELPCAYLPFPFLPDELAGVIGDVLEKSRSGEVLSFGRVRLEAARFRFAGGPRVTAGEIDAFRALLDGTDGAAQRRGAYIGALAGKLRAMNAGVGIGYVEQKGYRLVSANE